MGRTTETRVRDVMSEKFVPISADERLSTVEDIMTLGGVRHMPVVRAVSILFSLIVGIGFGAIPIYVYVLVT